MTELERAIDHLKLCAARLEDMERLALDYAGRRDRWKFKDVARMEYMNAGTKLVAADIWAAIAVLEITQQPDGGDRHAGTTLD